MPLRTPENFEHHFAQLSDIKLHYVREGTGPPLLLVHGWPGFWWEWHMNIAPLAEHFDVIVPDMRGYGDSEKPPLDRVELYHTDCVVADFVQLLDHLKIERIFIAGHDWGSEIVHKLVRRHRERIIKAAAFNPGGPGWMERYLGPDHFHESWYAMFHNLPMAVELVGSSREACKIYYRHFLSHWSYDPNLFSEEELEIYVDNFMKPGNIAGGFNFYKLPSSWSAIDRTITDCPMTFLQGMNDPVAPAAWTDILTSWHRNYTIEYLPECGHFVMREKPDLVNRRLREAFLG